jgi:hypothetical protein
MAYYTVRILLHDEKDNDYKNLHEQMEKKGFLRTIVCKGTKYHLPDGEYSRISMTSPKGVLEDARAAAHAVKKDDKKFEILVTKATVAWEKHNLRPVR